MAAAEAAYFINHHYHTAYSFEDIARLMTEEPLAFAAILAHATEHIKWLKENR